MRQIWSNKPQEILNKEIRRRVGAVLAEQHDESTEGRCYLALDALARSRTTETTNE